MRVMKGNYNFKDHNERCLISVRIKVENQALLLNPHLLYFYNSLSLSLSFVFYESANLPPSLPPSLLLLPIPLNTIV